MSLSYKEIRWLYYTGIGLLVLNAFPARAWIAPLWDFEVVTGLTAGMLIAILTGIAAFLAFNRRLG